MARAMSGRATTSDTSAVAAGLSNARAAPTSDTIAKMLVLLNQLPRVPTTSKAAAPASTIWQVAATRRRS